MGSGDFLSFASYHAHHSPDGRPEANDDKDEAFFLSGDHPTFCASGGWFPPGQIADGASRTCCDEPSCAAADSKDNR